MRIFRSSRTHTSVVFNGEGELTAIFNATGNRVDPEKLKRRPNTPAPFSGVTLEFVTTSEVWSEWSMPHPTSSV